jgi:hypothetical protein
VTELYFDTIFESHKLFINEAFYQMIDLYHPVF